MRKRNFNFYFDKLFWVFVMVLPVLIYLFTLLSYRFDDPTNSVQSFYAFLVDFGATSSTNIVYTTIISLFGNEVDSVFSMFGSSSPLLIYITYIVNIEILHIFVDIMVFIPRIAHKWISGAIREFD